jgi:hypothetical protein
MHAFALDKPNSSNAMWRWNGNVEFPGIMAQTPEDL